MSTKQTHPSTAALPGIALSGHWRAGLRPAPARQGRRLRGVASALVLVGSCAGLALLYGSSQAVTGGGVAHRGETVPLLVISLAATVGYLVVFVALHVLPTGHSPVDHAVSDYEVGRYAGLFRLGLYASSLWALTLAFALMRGVGTPPLAPRQLLYLLLIPVARIGMTVMPTALEGERLGRTGRLHYVFAIAAFTLTYLLISGTTTMLRATDHSFWASTPLAWIAWITAPALALVVITMVVSLRRVFGIAERLVALSRRSASVSRASACASQASASARMLSACPSRSACAASRASARTSRSSRVRSRSSATPSRR
jgi:hypothetical protein